MSTATELVVVLGRLTRGDAAVGGGSTWAVRGQRHTGRLGLAVRAGRLGRYGWVAGGMEDRPLVQARVGGAS